MKVLKTYNIDKDKYSEAKKYAKENKTFINTIIEKALDSYIEENKK